MEVRKFTKSRARVGLYFFGCDLTICQFNHIIYLWNENTPELF